MRRQSLFFTGPRRVEVREETVPPLEAGQVLVQTLVSAISPGTEMLFFREEFPPDLALDASISALAGPAAYPLKYGYAAVGRVIDRGAGVSGEWLSRLVFGFNPHESHFVASTADLQPLPAGLEPEAAAFLPSMETAITLVLDGQPLIGEQVAVFGQGIVGLLTTALLARFPLGSLITLDRHPLRREASLSAGAQASLDPAAPAVLDDLRERLSVGAAFSGADLAYELSGAPAALDQAIAVTGFSGRVVIGSWYGEKRAPLNLGGSFHRSRIRLISSQVSTIAPELRGRWTAQRRFAAAWNLLRLVKPEQFITQRFPLADAGRAYRLLDEDPGQAIQIILSYPE